MRLRYFAWVRERIGLPEEDIDLPADVATVDELIAWLRRRGPEYEHALAEPAAVRVAVDQVHVRGGTALSGAREVALFPPMTGG